jgi:glyoxylase-like metal-dependent hydrolase (beta-lactamase superfamily II)
MKLLHREDLFVWSEFDESRNIDFHSVLWRRPEGNVVIDPLPLSDHDQNHARELGDVGWIVITNSDHVRDAENWRATTGAKLIGPAGERETFPVPCDRWVSDGDEIVPGLKVVEMQGSKTPGELALILERETLITGDLVRGQRGGKLNLLPPAKLKDPAAAADSVKRLAALSDIWVVLPGDGWAVFRNGHDVLKELAAGLS